MDEKAQKQARIEEFLSTLPSHDFLPDEKLLRKAIMNRLDSQPHTAVAFDSMCQHHTVKTLKDRFFPREHPVGLKVWIENRMGAEVEVIKDERDGQLLIGY